VRAWKVQVHVPTRTHLQCAATSARTVCGGEIRKYTYHPLCRWRHARQMYKVQGTSIQLLSNKLVEQIAQFYVKPPSAKSPPQKLAWISEMSYCQQRSYSQPSCWGRKGCDLDSGGYIRSNTISCQSLIAIKRGYVPDANSRLIELRVCAWNCLILVQHRA
jgi:hypothetical protein